MTVQACTLDHTVFEQAQSNNTNKERPQCLAADFSRALSRERQVPNLKFQERHVQTFQNNKKKIPTLPQLATTVIGRLSLGLPGRCECRSEIIRGHNRNTLTVHNHTKELT